MLEKRIDAIRDKLGVGEVFIAVDPGNMRFLTLPRLSDPITTAFVVDRDGETAIVSSLEKNRSSDMLDCDIRTWSPYPGVKSSGKSFTRVLKRLTEKGKKI